MSCGYHLAGTGKQIPDHIKTVFIPDFENKTKQLQAVQFVSHAVREEFVKRSDLELVEDRSEADSILEGEILTFDVKPISFENTSGMFRLYINLKVKFIDLKNNKLIYEGGRLSFFENIEIDSTDFFSLDTETINKIRKKFSSNVVMTILGNF